MKTFNVAGPCSQEEHYMIEASTRLKGVRELIDLKQYFVIHAARQSGKTTYLFDLTKRLNADGKYYTVYCTLEGLQYVSDAEKGIPHVIKNIKEALFMCGVPKSEVFAENADYSYYTGVLHVELNKFCKILDKPLVIFFDESDCLTGNTMISFLRQLRMGYVYRLLTPFVHSVALVGMRNIRDYVVPVRDEKESLGSASPFNISTEAMTLKNFTKEEIASLYKQHTDATGQIFEEDAIDYIYEKTCGQPWLVNAVAREVIVKMLNSDYSKAVTAEMVQTAIQTIIIRRDTHIDSLLNKLHEERVRKIIEPMIMGEDFYEFLSDDYQYAVDLGLIKRDEYKIIPANPIYAEVIIRTLSYGSQQKFISEKSQANIPNYLKDGKIDVNALLRYFQCFWRENSGIWVEKFQYKEAAPHLILQAFLQRVINGGGDIKREMAANTKRSDLCIVYEGEKYPIELKIRRGEKTLQEGLEQLSEYMDIFGSNEGWLLIFDRNPEVSWDEKIYYQQEIVGGKIINVFGV